MLNLNDLFLNLFKYYKNSLPWMYSRNIYILIVLFESIIFVSLINLLFKDFYTFEKSIIFFYYFKLILWFVFSYIINRYKPNYQKYEFKKVHIRQIKKSIILIIIFSILEILFLNIFNIIEQNFINLNNTLVFNLIFIVICIFLNLIKNIFYYNLSQRKKRWILFNNQNDLLDKSDLNNNLIDIFSNQDVYSIKKINFKMYDGIVLVENKIKSSLKELLVDEIKDKKIKIISIEEWFHRYSQRIPVELINDKFIKKLEFKIYENKINNIFLIKRIFEFIFTLFLLLLSTPILVFASILVYLEDNGPIFYSQSRVGEYGKTFTIWKLRSMRVNAEKDGVKWATKNDKRVTKTGKILRKTRIDELPQLIGVLQGKMNLIGPRPERPEFKDLLSKEINYYHIRSLMKPGITGWAQVNYPYGASVNDTKNKLSYDLYYLKNYSLLLDILIFFKTIRLIFNARGSEPESKISS